MSNLYKLRISLLLVGAVLCHAALANPVQSVKQSSPGFTAVAVPKDPTQPPTTAHRGAADTSPRNTNVKSSAQKPILTSILSSDQRRLAVINGKLLREGERVAGMTLVRVGKDEVQLQGNQQQRALTLRLAKSNIGKDYR